MNISIFHNMTSKLPLPGLLEGVANLIRSDEKLKVFTESYRQTGSKSFKSEAQLFAVACRFEGGKGKENITGLTGLSLVDFDHIVSPSATDSPSAELKRNINGEENMNNLPSEFRLSSADSTLTEMKRKIIADPHTLMCYTTISGNGLRVIFRYELPSEFRINSADNNIQSAELKRNISGYYQSAFYAGNAYYEKLLDCKADMQCKNLTRLSGLAHDPDVFLRDPSEVVPFTAEEISTASAVYAKQSKEEKQMQRIQTYFDTLIAPQLAKANIKFESGSHNEYVMRVGYRLAERRFSKKIALKWALQKFGANYPDTEQVINSCYANKAPSSSPKGERTDSKVASVEEIKSFLDGHVSLRFNEITSRVEFLHNTNLTNEGMYTSNPSPSAEADEKFVKFERFVFKNNLGVWQPLNDRKVNSLWSKMSEVTRVNKQELCSIIESDYVPLYHPFKEYLSALEKWTNANDSFVLNTNCTNLTNKADIQLSAIADKRFVKFERFVFKKDYDYIRELAATVRVKGGEQEQILWYRYLKKWLVGMVASWLSDDVVNNVILVLIGEQGAYKTTWFNYLLPPPLKQYFYTKTNANRMSKDDLLTLAQYALVCCEELDTMRPSELNQLKAVVTMPSIDERAAYAHYHTPVRDKKL